MKTCKYENKCISLCVTKVREDSLDYGKSDTAIHIDSTEDLEMITVFFQPYAAKMMMNIPGKEFYNGTCDFDSLENVRFRDLKARILNAASAEACIDMIEQFIMEQLVRTQGSPYMKPLAHVLGELMRNPDRKSVV